MKTYKVEGYKKVSYFSKKKNDTVSGTSLYLSRDIGGEDDSFGRECCEVWLNELSTYSPFIGDEVIVMRNDRGYVDDVVSYG